MKTLNHPNIGELYSREWSYSLFRGGEFTCMSQCWPLHEHLFLCVLQCSCLRWLKLRRLYTWLWSMPVEVSDVPTILIIISIECFQSHWWLLCLNCSCLIIYWRYLSNSVLFIYHYFYLWDLVSLEKVKSNTALLFSLLSFSVPCIQMFPIMASFFCIFYISFSCLICPCYSLFILCDLWLPRSFKEAAAQQMKCCSVQISLHYCLGSLVQSLAPEIHMRGLGAKGM